MLLEKGPVSLCCRRVTVCLSHAGIVSKRLNLGSRKQRHTIGQRLQFSDAKTLGEIQTGSPRRSRQKG